MKKIDRHAQLYTKLGLKISYYRKLSGLTQENLAEKVNISRTHLSNIEAPNMTTPVSLEILFDIAEVLEIPVYRLFMFEE